MLDKWATPAFISAQRTPVLAYRFYKKGERKMLDGEIITYGLLSAEDSEALEQCLHPFPMPEQSQLH